MSEINGQALIDQAKSAAQLARESAEAAENYSDAVTTAVHAASEVMAMGGGIDPFVFRLSIFVMAIFVGYYVVWSVTAALHTPLMSVTNAISSVIVVGALLALGVDAAATSAESSPGWAHFVGFIALVLASVNIFGGFLVTQRMLSMYKKKD